MATFRSDRVPEAPTKEHPSEGQEKVVRGGCFYLDDDNAQLFLRSASRYSVPPDVDFYGIVGMRLVLAPVVAGAN
jgi:hypothetical protein